MAKISNITVFNEGNYTFTDQYAQDIINGLQPRQSISGSVLNINYDNISAKPSNVVNNITLVNGSGYDIEDTNDTTIVTNGIVQGSISGNVATIISRTITSSGDVNSITLIDNSKYYLEDTELENALADKMFDTLRFVDDIIVDKSNSSIANHILTTDGTYTSITQHTISTMGNANKDVKSHILVF